MGLADGRHLAIEKLVLNVSIGSVGETMHGIRVTQPPQAE
jgi:hypothetical protein